MKIWWAKAACLALWASTTAVSMPPKSWMNVELSNLVGIDDDISRNITREKFFDNIQTSERRFSENGFEWHLIRFSSVDKPEGPTWVVPHDDENAAFDAMISAIQKYGGTGIAVNSGAGSARLQSGDGVCGVKPARVTGCDPNRNFDARSPLFTAAFLSIFRPNQPVIALHTNSHGFSGDGAGGRGDITIYDRSAFARGEVKARKNGRLAVNPLPEMDNPDTLALSAFIGPRGKPTNGDAACGLGMSHAGIHFWHEAVGKSDASLSNYLALNRPDISYMNAESRAEIDLALAAGRHAVMIKTYLEKCTASWDKPATRP
ncbi:hypothetical protein [Sphingorhabdus sp.]|uniref:hypothetical protein n=1 Tax=Sphingorhabdus sp. TaxID=1902408 RepID=UPI00391D0968